MSAAVNTLPCDTVGSVNVVAPPTRTSMGPGLKTVLASMPSALNGKGPALRNVRGSAIVVESNVVTLIVAAPAVVASATPDNKAATAAHGAARRRWGR